MLNMGLKRRKIRETTHPSFVPGRTVKIHFKNREIGIMGEIHPQVLNNFELKNPAGAFEINLEEIM